MKDDTNAIKLLSEVYPFTFEELLELYKRIGSIKLVEERCKKFVS